MITVCLIWTWLFLVKLIRDVLNVSEMILRSPAPSTLGKYRALRCSIEAVPTSSSEFQDVAALLQDKGNNASKRFVCLIFRRRVGPICGESQYFSDLFWLLFLTSHKSTNYNFIQLGMFIVWARRQAQRLFWIHLEVSFPTFCALQRGPDKTSSACWSQCGAWDI